MDRFKREYHTNLQEDLSAHRLGRPGSDLLSHALRRSTIGAKGFHGRVRDGIGCRPLAITTRSSKTALQRNQSKHKDTTGSETEGPPKPSPSVFLTPTRVSLNYPYLARSCGCTWCFSSSIERLGPVSFTHCCASTPGLSTWSSSTALKGDLVLRGASRLDAFSGYPVRS